MLTGQSGWLDDFRTVFETHGHNRSNYERFTRFVRRKTLASERHSVNMFLFKKKKKTGMRIKILLESRCPSIGTSRVTPTIAFPTVVYREPHKMTNDDVSILNDAYT